MSKIEVNTVAPQCGTTLTLGESGDTVTLGTGASQSGFGRTGTVDWETTKKTGDFTAANGEGYFVDTGGGVVTATLPSSPSAGNIVYIKDYDGNFGTNKCTVARNGSNIRGATDNIDLAKNNAGAVFIYVDATEGWQVFFDGADTDATASFITATGGTITTSGNCKIHTFTSPGTFTVSSLSDCSANNVVSHVVVAGGGSGGNAKDGTNGNAGGAGAGGYREAKSPATPYTASPLDGGAPNAITVTAAAFPITVGAGGAAKTTCSAGTTGSNSIFSTITSAGGGGGGGGPGTGLSGGSGGGASNAGSIGSGNTPPVSPPQGNNGGAQHSPGNPCTTSGGGGGAGAVGGNGNPGGPAGNGGVGVASSINGTPTTRAGGGGGGGNSGQAGGGSGGSGGGGAGGTYGGPACGVNGTANTGGGGGATASNCTSPVTSGAGGSGIVIIRYKFQ